MSIALNSPSLKSIHSDVTFLTPSRPPSKTASQGLSVRPLRFTGSTLPIELPDVSTQRHVRLSKAQAQSIPLYPTHFRYKTHQIQVSPVHTLYVAEFGNPNGIPVICPHGGPGGGSNPITARLFDPAAYRIILFDQRGCGQSTPNSELNGNTTQELVADMEKIRETLQINRWAVAGHSWGSTLGLAYAQAHPDKVTGLILSGVFLGNQDAIHWLYQGGAKDIFPDLWERTLAILPPEDRTPENILPGFLKRMQNPDPELRNKAMAVWNDWESNLRTAKPGFSSSNPQKLDERDRTIALIECFYALKNYFLKPDQLLTEANKIREIPTWLVQGRNDWVCPFKNAWDLHQQLPKAQLVEVEETGHSDMSILQSRVLASEALKKKLTPPSLSKLA